MSASITEISQRVTESTQIAGEAVAQAEQTNTTVQGLVEAAQKIGEVTGLINEIAEQTNLLALNATIEAARAGDAGKGFAVVASEVKALASQTGKATDEIASQIGAIQSVSAEAVAAIKKIGEINSQANEIATAIAASVGEQGVATQEIAHSVTQAATGTQEVSAGIAEISDATRRSEELAGKVKESADGIANQMAQLQDNLTNILRESTAGNRRAAARVQPAQMTATIVVNGEDHAVGVHDISATGAEVDAIAGISEGDLVSMDLPDFGAVSATVTRTTPKSCAMHFAEDQQAQQRLSNWLAGTAKAAA